MTTPNDSNRPAPYNGWTNYETWNVAPWLTADPDNYELCKHHRDRGNTYADIALELANRGTMSTPDGVLYWSDKIDIQSLDQMLYELP